MTPTQLIKQITWYLNICYFNKEVTPSLHVHVQLHYKTETCKQHVGDAHVHVDQRMKDYLTRVWMVMVTTASGCPPLVTVPRTLSA